MEKYFSWNNPGIYHFVGSPSSGFLRDVKLAVENLLDNSRIFWFDFPHRFISYGFKETKKIDSLQVFQPDTLDNAVKVVDELELNLLLLSPQKVPYIIIADFPYWYALGKETNRSILTKLTYITSILASISLKFDIKVLLLNELRQNPETGFVKPYLDFLVHRYTAENYYKE